MNAISDSHGRGKLDTDVIKYPRHHHTSDESSLGHHHQNNVPSFLEHPLCKALNIDNTSKQKLRLFERRCAMDLNTYQVGFAPEISRPLSRRISQNVRSLERRCAMDLNTYQADFVDISRPLFRRISQVLMHEDFDGMKSSKPHLCSDSHSCSSRSSTYRRSSSVFIEKKRDLRWTNAQASHEEEAYRPLLLSFPLRLLVTALRNPNDAKNQIQLDNTTGTTNNVLLDEMKRIEDQNIWNTFRKRDSMYI